MSASPIPPLTQVLRLRHRGRSYRIEGLLRPGRGPGRRPGLLYLHGLGCTKEDARGATALAALRGHTLAAFDFPGCGGSAYWSEVPLTMADLVALTRRAVRALELPRPWLVGHSMGGLVALLYARRHPREVAGLVEIEGNLVPDDCFLSRQVFRRAFLGRERRFFADLRKRLAPGGAGMAEYAARLPERVAPRAFFDYARSLVDWSDGYPLLAQFLALPVPRAFVHGAENAHLPYLDRLRAAGIPVVAIRGSGHLPMVTNPEAFYRALARLVAAPQRRLA